jgi:hypothetical protein
VHIDQTGHQIFSAPVDNLRVFRNFYVFADFGDDAVAHQHGLIRQNAFFVHRNDVHAGKSDGLRSYGDEAE